MNDDLNEIIGDTKGKIPTFGYPIMTYSPKTQERQLTDRDVWQHAIVSDGNRIKDVQENGARMISTDQLKIEMSQRITEALRKGRSLSQIHTRNSHSYPDGVKFHMYRNV